MYPSQFGSPTVPAASVPVPGNSDREACGWQSSSASGGAPGLKLRQAPTARISYVSPSTVSSARRTTARTARVADGAGGSIARMLVVALSGCSSGCENDSAERQRCTVEGWTRTWARKRDVWTGVCPPRVRLRRRGREMGGRHGMGVVCVHSSSERWLSVALRTSSSSCEHAASASRKASNERWWEQSDRDSIRSWAKSDTSRGATTDASSTIRRRGKRCAVSLKSMSLGVSLRTEK
ncbi:hypothetical protein GSI_04085 [Ganoderma sinense ZZ0214-1]|uniref:Uncharacterized protein n=1 Tax=Ganoderma sinense ZZ0214-1 TaxID=1077348 RepID=A0A2G8SI81_9APHY|nr:hypothetical protein GSI_04085 [Ganoderma sinense ZZ0214-1]